MSTTPDSKIFPITNRDLLIFRLAKSRNLSYLRCRDSRCKQNVYKIHDKNFKSKIGNHLSICRFQHQQSDEQHQLFETTPTKIESYLGIKRKSSESSYNGNIEHNSTSNESKQQKIPIKTEKVGVFEIKDEVSSINNTSSLEIDIDDCIDKDAKFQDDDLLTCNKLNYDNHDIYVKMFSHFVGFMETFLTFYNQQEDKRYQNDDKRINDSKINSDLGEVDINN